mgnify:CR=1 FL=1
MMHPMVQSLCLGGLFRFKLLLISLQEPAVVLGDTMVLLLVLVENEIKFILLFKFLRYRVEVGLDIRALLLLQLLPFLILFVIDIVDFVLVVLFPLDKLVERSVVLESCQNRLLESLDAIVVLHLRAIFSLSEFLKLFLLKLLVLDGHFLDFLHLGLATLLLLSKDLVLKELLVASEDIGGFHSSSFFGANEALNHLSFLESECQAVIAHPVVLCQFFNTEA